MSTAQITVDLGGITELLNEGQSLAVLDDITNALEGQMQSITRRGHSHHRVHMADQYGTEHAHPTSDGGEAAVTNASPFFHLEQFGSIHQPPQRMAERAIRALGLIVEDVPR